MIEHLWDCVLVFASNPANVAISLVSLTISISALYFIRAGTSKERIWATYSHIAFLIFPVAFFTFNMSCQLAGIPCDATKDSLYSLLIALGGSAIFGTILLPHIHHIGAKKLALPAFLKAQAEKNGLKLPSLFVSDTAVPQAFSHRAVFPEIYISMGMLELLGKKEIEAVLLHELGHLKNNSALLKFSLNFLHLSSPIARLMPIIPILESEEGAADSFAASAQGTWRHLKSAKKKLSAYQAAKKAAS